MRRGAKGRFLIYIHPGINLDDINGILRDLGVTKKGTKYVENGELKLRALRWWICQDKLLEVAVEQKWLGGMEEWSRAHKAAKLLIAYELGQSGLPVGQAFSRKPDSIRSWWVRKDGPLKRAQEELGLRLEPRKIVGDPSARNG